MGEEQKKPEGKNAEEMKKQEEEKRPEEKKVEEPKAEEKKTEDSKETPPPLDEIVLRVYMHCEGCARKVLRCLRGFQGVEDVKADCKTHKVTVKGKDVDPLKVRERVEKKSHRKVELLFPIPKPTEPEVAAEPKLEEPKLEETKEEEAKVMTVLLKVHMHCEACAFEIQKRIMRMKGVESADPDLKSSQVAVKGVFDPSNLVEYVWKRTGKHAAIVKKEAEKKEEEKGKEEKEVKKEEKKEEAKTGEGEEKKTELMMKNEVYYYPTKYTTEYYAYPQIFSDENPNACSVM